MALYHCSVDPIQRSKGHSAVAAAAYRSATCLLDERTGILHDYSRRRGVLYAQIVAPDEAPAWAQERGQVWNEAERSHVHVKAQTARDIEVSLPHELEQEPEAWIAQCETFARMLCARYQTVVDFAIHQPVPGNDERNVHCHLLIGTQRLTSEGFERRKIQALDHPETGPQEIHFIREQWALLTNRALERAGRPERVDHRSYAARGLDREATQHMGKQAQTRERLGQRTAIGNKNRAIEARNARRARREEAAKVIDLAIEREQRRKAQERQAREDGKRQRLGQWEARVKAKVQSRQHDELINLDRKHSREAGHFEDLMQEAYGNGLARGRAEMAALEKRQTQGGLFYRLLGGAEQDRHRLAALRRTQENGEWRQDQAWAKLRADQQREKDDVARDHAKEWQALEEVVADAWRRGRPPEQHRRQQDQGRERGAGL